MKQDGSGELTADLLQDKLNTGLVWVNVPKRILIYSFKTLSPIDFENLARDLLQSELSIRLESFKAGRDEGIDLRYTTTKNRSFIVKAKHYAGTGFSGLLSHLKQKEKSKIEKLNPDRYLLVTSVDLSPANKDDIRQALFPHIKAPKDIYGKEDLNNNSFYRGVLSMEAGFLLLELRYKDCSKHFVGVVFSGR